RLHAGVDQRGRDGEHVSLHVRPGVDLPCVAVGVVHERPRRHARGLAEEHAHRRAIRDAFGIELRHPRCRQLGLGSAVLRRIFGAHAAGLRGHLLRCSLTQWSNALAALLVDSPGSRPPGSPNLSTKSADRALAWLVDRLDREGEAALRHADRHLVALLLADQRAPDRRVHRDAAGGRVTFDPADEVIRLGLALGVDDVDRRARTRDARVRLLDDLGAADHLLQLVDPVVEETDLLLRLLVLRVVLDVTRLKGLLQALARLDTALLRNVEIALELFEPLGSQQNRFGEIHLQPRANNTDEMDPSDLRAGVAERLSGTDPIDAETFNAACFMLSRSLDEIELCVPQASPLVRRLMRI